MKILIARTDVIGDMVLTTPVFAAVKKKYPNAEIYVLCQPLTVPLLDGNPYITGIIEETHHQLLKQARELRTYCFDIFIGVWENPYYALLSLLARIPLRVGFATSLLSWLLYTHTKRFAWKDATMLQIDANLSVLALLGIVATSVLFPPMLFVSVPKKERKIVIAVGARGAHKLWRPEGFIEVIRHLLITTTYQIVLIGGSEERAIGTAIAKQIPDRTRVDNRVGILNLTQTIKEIGSAAYFIGADSGPMHIAAAYCVPVIGLYITKNQKPMRWPPFHTCHVIIRAQYACPYVCRSSRCTLSICTNGILVEQILRSFDQLQQGSGYLDDAVYWQQQGFSILVVGNEPAVLEIIGAQLKTYNWKAVSVTTQIRQLRSIIVERNVNVVHFVDGAQSLKRWLLQQWVSNLLPSYPLFVYSSDINHVLDSYVEGFKKI